MPPEQETAEIRYVEPRIWRACAGSSVQIPAVHSRVYYFPQGHLEHCTSSMPLSYLAFCRPMIPCIVNAVYLLADSVTDEVFARVSLQPVHPSQFSSLDLFRGRGGGGGGGGREGGEGGDDEEDEIVAFAKTLTPSDANNGGGFSVPRFCADSIFPTLNYQAEPPVQNLYVTDIHGVVWDFRHIYRGTPRRHLLTTGWSRFVNNKKLIAGDSVVFMRNSRGDMFIGVRRAIRSSNNGRGYGGSDYARWRDQIGGMKEGSGDIQAFCRTGQGSLMPEMVAQAAQRAAQGLPFEVVYYPRAGWSDFVVRAGLVDASLNISWRPGMRVKMATETEDSSRLTWFQGTVSSSMIPETGPWRGSPWRMLQVAWDESEVLQSVKRVSPWQVEFVASPQLHASFLPTKRLKLPHNSGFLSEGDRGIPFATNVLTNSTIGNMSPSLNCIAIPAGMQGARQNHLNPFSMMNFMNENTPPTGTDNFFGNSMVPGLRVSTELNIGSSLSDELSPDSQSSFRSFGTDLVGYNSTRAGNGCFQLFGTIIQFNGPPGNGYDDSEDDGSKGYSETDVVNNTLDLSLTYPDTAQNDIDSL